MYIYIYIYIIYIYNRYIHINIFRYIHMKTKMMAHIKEKLSYIMKYEWLKNDSKYFVTCKYFRLILQPPQTIINVEEQL